MSKVIEQAVILAGGQGTRLKPLTDTTPKPMISFHGKPFLHYLLDMLRKQKIKKVLLLLGYLPEKVKDYFQDGSRFNMQIDYDITDVENDTGKRMKLAEEKIDEYFLFMYCDNYWPLELEKMQKFFFSSNALAQITTYNNNDHYTKSNVSINEQNSITLYDKSRQAPNLKGVDIGFALMNKKVLSFLSDENENFESAVYPQLVKEGSLKAYPTEHRYYSVSTPQRLAITEDFLRFDSTILLDRDGVLNKKAPQGEYITSWKTFEWLPGVKEALALFHQAGYRIILITNQAGIARQQMTKEDLDSIHTLMKEELLQQGILIEAIYICPHHWDEDCDCRKPKPGMLYQAQKEFHLDLSRTLFIGDDSRDQEAAVAAACPHHLLSDSETLLDVATEFLRV